VAGLTGVGSTRPEINCSQASVEHVDFMTRGATAECADGRAERRTRRWGARRWGLDECGCGGTRRGQQEDDEEEGRGAKRELLRNP
jgi:hypothetical protein